MVKTTILLTLSILVLLFTAPLVNAQEGPVCGNSIVESPEKCDDGVLGSNKCTPQCGQKILGWSWNSHFGWSSLNWFSCDYIHPSLPPSICGEQNFEYYTQITAEDTVRGWAWSDNVGWICFGIDCSDYGTPPFGQLEAQLVYDITENPQVTGWAKIISLGGMDGWISLNCLNNASCGTSLYYTQAYESEFNAERRLTLGGWSWNPIVGWINFNPSIDLKPWLQTRYGDIYSKGGLQGNSVTGFNATYRILSNGAIENFKSLQGTDFWVDPGFGQINFPSSKTRYSNILGKIDFDKMLCIFEGPGFECINQLGKTVVDLNQNPLQSGQVLNGKIYYKNGDLTINNPIVFNNGSELTSGAGTIIIDGNLIINQNITYQSILLSNNFRNMASVIWIVKGDVIVSPNVSVLAGSFVVIGNGTQCAAGDVEVSRCGQFYSCDTAAGDCSLNRLTVNGMLMARKFYLERTYSDENEVPPQGSEVIIYDGRLLANTPPGVGEFTSALPTWRSQIFTP